MTVTPEREESVDFTDTYANATQVVIVRSNLMREKERLSARQNGAAALFAGNETTKERCILWKIYSISLTVTL